VRVWKIRGGRGENDNKREGETGKVVEELLEFKYKY